MAHSDEKLGAIADQLKKGVAPPTESVRSFLLWFGAERRGYGIVHSIRRALPRHGLVTIPDFHWTSIDGVITCGKAPLDAKDAHALVDDSASDATYRIGRLPSANRAPVNVSTDT